MLDSTELDERPRLAGKVRRLELQRQQDYSLGWAFPKLRSLAIETNVLQATRPSALRAFLDRCCTPLLPPNITLYDEAFRHMSRSIELMLPKEVLRLGLVAELARRPGLKCLTVWPALLLRERTLTGAQRQRLGPAPFRDLVALKARTSAAAAAQLLALVPGVAVLDLHMMPDAAARSKNVLRAIARQPLPRLRELTLRFPGDFAVDYAGLMALASRPLTVLELRVGRYEEWYTPSVPLNGPLWRALVARLAHVERLWLPRKCPVLNGEAMGVAGIHCRHLRSMHLHNVWNIGALAALTPVTFPHLESASVDSVGQVLLSEK
jgi:hypothetical protein